MRFQRGFVLQEVIEHAIQAIIVGLLYCSSTCGGISIGALGLRGSRALRTAGQVHDRL
jgi:hypothetical protein